MTDGMAVGWNMKVYLNFWKITVLIYHSGIFTVKLVFWDCCWVLLHEIEDIGSVQCERGIQMYGTQFDFSTDAN